MTVALNLFYLRPTLPRNGSGCGSERHAGAKEARGDSSFPPQAVGERCPGMPMGPAPVADAAQLWTIPIWSLLFRTAMNGKPGRRGSSFRPSSRALLRHISAALSLHGSDARYLGLSTT